WALGAITPILKKGDPTDPNNYRGITVGHVLGKLYALVVNARLTAWLEARGLRAKGQSGFRQGRRTVDNCFILRALAERYRSGGVKLFACAVDFEKAFDSVNHGLLWAALRRAGIGGAMLQAIQAMYADVPVCVRSADGLSGCFQAVLGVKQGCPLSPLLFGIFLDDFEEYLQSAAGEAYCDAKHLTVNTSKTQVMILRPGGGAGNGRLAAGEAFTYAGRPIEVVSSVKYLGLTFAQLSKKRGFAGRVQGLPRQASSAVALAELGRQPLPLLWVRQLVRFWNRLQDSMGEPESLLGWALADNLSLMREGGDLAVGSPCWSRRWQQFLQSAPTDSGTLLWLTHLDEAAVLERAAAAYVSHSLEPAQQRQRQAAGGKTAQQRQQLPAVSSQR
ncbi:hypothetical protein ABPG75_006545, partial [Micractinium tetrahymenae]